MISSYDAGKTAALKKLGLNTAAADTPAVEEFIAMLPDSGGKPAMGRAATLNRMGGWGPALNITTSEHNFGMGAD